jgi:hypothetical protein
MKPAPAIVLAAALMTLAPIGSPAVATTELVHVDEAGVIVA